MKNLIAFAFFTLVSYYTPVFGQTKSQDPVYVNPPKKTDYKNLLYAESNEVYTKVDTYPEYAGGFAAFQDFLKKNVKNIGETGRVIATFVVEKNGSLSNIEVLRSFSDKANTEAVRVLKIMPKWKPGIYRGDIVRTQYTIPISFNKPAN